MKSADENSRSSFRNKFYINQSESKTSINFGVENQWEGTFKVQIERKSWLYLRTH